ncbi:MAG: hypothetical protein RLZZ268_1362 [Cyanobacteriota bacterium]|jgi:serine/threonine protein kinase HipA of HipAB toxin-antitoxin module
MSGRNELRRHVTSSNPGRDHHGRHPYGLAHAARRTMSPTPNSRPELVSQLAMACLGAGVVTTVAVAQGQNPLTALGITLFSAVAAVMVGQVI